MDIWAPHVHRRHVRPVPAEKMANHRRDLRPTVDSCQSFCPTGNATQRFVYTNRRRVVPERAIWSAQMPGCRASGTAGRISKDVSLGLGVSRGKVTTLLGAYRSPRTGLEFDGLRAYQCSSLSFERPQPMRARAGDTLGSTFWADFKQGLKEGHMVFFTPLAPGVWRYTFKEARRGGWRAAFAALESASALLLQKKVRWF
jgi:hypothetical protein